MFLQPYFYVVVVMLIYNMQGLQYVTAVRPIYNIAHMVNAVDQIDEYLEYGANAIEADIKFSTDGTPTYVYHGIPCDAWRDCLREATIPNYVEALRQRTIPTSAKFNSKFVLMMFDVKITSGDGVNRKEAGLKFADNILIPFYKNNPTKLKICVSVPDMSGKEFISSLLGRLKAAQPETVRKIGFELSWEKDKTPSEIEEFFKGLGVAAGHAWLSRGISNFFASTSTLEDALKSYVQYRNNGNFFSKVYSWTLDKQATAEKYLGMGLDGVITNYPDEVDKAIKAGTDLKLATLDDNPFRKP